MSVVVNPQQIRFEWKDVREYYADLKEEAKAAARANRAGGAAEWKPAHRGFTPKNSTPCSLRITGGETDTPHVVNIPDELNTELIKELQAQGVKLHLPNSQDDDLPVNTVDAYWANYIIDRVCGYADEKKRAAIAALSEDARKDYDHFLYLVKSREEIYALEKEIKALSHQAEVFNEDDEKEEEEDNRKDSPIYVKLNELNSTLLSLQQNVYYYIQNNIDQYRKYQGKADPLSHYINDIDPAGHFIDDDEDEDEDGPTFRDIKLHAERIANNEALENVFVWDRYPVLASEAPVEIILQRNNDDNKEGDETTPPSGIRWPVGGAGGVEDHLLLIKDKKIEEESRKDFQLDSDDPVNIFNNAIINKYTVFEARCIAYADWIFDAVESEITASSDASIATEIKKYRDLPKDKLTAQAVLHRVQALRGAVTNSLIAGDVNDRNQFRKFLKFLAIKNAILTNPDLFDEAAAKPIEEVESFRITDLHKLVRGYGVISFTLAKRQQNGGIELEKVEKFHACARKFDPFFNKNDEVASIRPIDPDLKDNSEPDKTQDSGSGGGTNSGGGGNSTIINSALKNTNNSGVAKDKAGNGTKTQTDLEIDDEKSPLPPQDKENNIDPSGSGNDKDTELEVPNGSATDKSQQETRPEVTLGDKHKDTLIEEMTSAGYNKVEVEIVANRFDIANQIMRYAKVRHDQIEIEERIEVLVQLILSEDNAESVLKHTKRIFYLFSKRPALVEDDLWTFLDIINEDDDVDEKEEDESKDVKSESNKKLSGSLSPVSLKPIGSASKKTMQDKLLNVEEEKTPAKKKGGVEVGSPHDSKSPPPSPTKLDIELNDDAELSEKRNSSTSLSDLSYFSEDDESSEEISVKMPANDMKSVTRPVIKKRNNKTLVDEERFDKKPDRDNVSLDAKNLSVALQKGRYTRFEIEIILNRQFIMKKFGDYLEKIDFGGYDGEELLEEANSIDEANEFLTYLTGIRKKLTKAPSKMTDDKEFIQAMRATEMMSVMKELLIGKYKMVVLQYYNKAKTASDNNEIEMQYNCAMDDIRSTKSRFGKDPSKPYRDRLKFFDPFLDALKPEEPKKSGILESLFNRR